MQKTQRRIFHNETHEGIVQYALVTIYYSYDIHEHMNVAKRIKYQLFDEQEGKDQPAIVDSICNILDDIQTHPVELNLMTKKFEIVECSRGCSICR